jgi:D-serine deaminase-like pyridoxal phosphate-dependent protein
MTQTWTNINPNLSEWKETLKQNMIGKNLSDLRTPSLVIDRTRLERNCQRLGKITTELKIKVRVHVKTHKAS